MAVALPAAPLRAWRRRIFVVSWVTYAAYYLRRVNLAVALPAVQADLGWSKAMLGLVGSTFYWVYALSQLANGHLGERLSARRFVALGMLLSAGLNLLFGSLSAFGLMLAVWAWNGWAQATGWGPIMKTLSRWFPPEGRGRLTALFAPCYVAGHALSWALAGWLIARWSWREVFWAPGLLLLALAALWYLLVRDQPEDLLQGETEALQETNPAAPRARRDLLSGLKALWSTPGLSWVPAVCFGSGMVKDALTLWGPTYLIEQSGMSLSAAALSGTLIPISGVMGAMLAGWLLHRVSREREGPVVSIMALLIAAGACGLLMLHRSLLAVLMLGLMALGSHGMNALLLASLPLSLGPEGRVSAAAGSLDFIPYVGGGLSVLGVGLLQDLLA
ncbi:MAG: MFS transporter [Anaerolineae bacterium]|nr:MFS transporter [Anaerolineae bacterium]